jgi:hypothetical protein
MFPFFLTNIVLSGITAYVASYKGRHAFGWFCLSFLTGWLYGINILVLVVLLIMPNRHKVEARHSHESSWRRRHHESFEQERNMNRQFREHVVNRLDRQDEALGLPPVDNLPKELAASGPTEVITYPVLGNGSWYLVIEGREQGPYPETEVQNMLSKSEINGDVYAWSEGMQDWQRAGTIGNFSEHC